MAMACSLLLLVACAKGDENEKKRAQVDEKPSASAIASASAPPPQGDPPTGWSLLRPAGGGYSVFVPGVPEKLDSGLSEMQVIKRASGSAYMAMCMEAGKTERENDETFEGVRRGKIGERKVLSTAAVDDGRGKGERLAIQLETDKGIYVSNELIFRGKRQVCSFSALVPATSDEKADIEKFFASVRLEN